MTNDNKAKVMNNLANHYRKNQDDANAVKYYLMAIDLKSSDAAYNLATYYEDKGDYDNMVKYCLIAIDLGSAAAAYYVATYYEVVKHDCANMTKYYSIAINMGDIKSIYIIASYCKKFKEYGKMIEYYNIAINKGEAKAMYKVGKYYEKKGDEIFIKYYKMAIKKFHIESLDRLIRYYAKLKKYDDIMALTMSNKYNTNYAVRTANKYDLYIKYKDDLDPDNLKVLEFISKLEETESLCKICLLNNSLVLPCSNKHKICGDCILSTKECPYCKTTLIEKDVNYLIEMD